eukprot:scaffold501010_cov35-Prasinocladus_malaysianus.AAC.1
MDSVMHAPNSSTPVSGLHCLSTCRALTMMERHNMEQTCNCSKRKSQQQGIICILSMVFKQKTSRCAGCHVLLSR